MVDLIKAIEEAKKALYKKSIYKMKVIIYLDI